jgi:hypothetical protein
MSNEQSGVSKAFQVFLERAPKHAGAWMIASPQVTSVP